MTKAKEICLIIIILMTTILAIAPVQAATIQGNVYGPDLEIIKKAIVEINSTPKQSIVANTGSYSFVVPQGTYEIEAFYTVQGTLLYDKEKITVPAEGAFVLDLILFETPDIEDIKFDESELKMIEDLLKEKKKINWEAIIAIVVIIVVLVVVLYFIFKKRKSKKIKKRKRFKAKAIEFKEEKPIGDEAMKKTLEILKREKRVTQKDIRKELKLSEAKMSLIIADLEAQGKVKKIKRGRGNIIIYQE
ncbi:MAG: hypothetical protein N3G19_00715 [Candidatus Pacearchaeota archaeon]|nr:hypothetical protein [Candidatus Pacearchaeota archaeon]